MAPCLLVTKPQSPLGGLRKCLIICVRNRTNTNPNDTEVRSQRCGLCRQKYTRMQCAQFKIANRKCAESRTSNPLLSGNCSRNKFWIQIQVSTMPVSALKRARRCCLAGAPSQKQTAQEKKKSNKQTAFPNLRKLGRPMSPPCAPRELSLTSRPSSQEPRRRLFRRSHW